MKSFQKLLPLLCLVFIVVTASTVKAGSAPSKLKLIGVAVSQSQMSLVSTCLNYACPTHVITKSNAQITEMFSDFLSISEDDTPLAFLNSMISDMKSGSGEAESSSVNWLHSARETLRQAADENIPVCFILASEGTELKAAGLPAAINQTMSKVDDKGQTLAQSLEQRIRKHPALGDAIVGQLTAANCFTRDTKAEFQKCAFMAVLGSALDVQFTEQYSLVEDGQYYLNEVGNYLADLHKVKTRNNYILHISASADLMAQSNFRLLDTHHIPGQSTEFEWMTKGISQYGMDQNGGFEQLGYEMVEEHIATPLDTVRNTEPDITVSDFLIKSDKPLLQLHVALLKTYAAKNRLVYKSGSKVLSYGDIAQDLYVKRTTKGKNTGKLVGYGYGFQGEFLALVTDPAVSPMLYELSDITEEMVSGAIEQTKGTIRRVQGDALIKLALYAGLMEPAMGSQCSLFVIGSRTGWVTEKLKTRLEEQLRDTEFIKRIYIQYRKLSAKDFSGFDLINGIERIGNSVLQYGWKGLKADGPFRLWLKRVPDLIGATYSTSENEFNNMVAMALANRFVTRIAVQ